MKNIFNRFMLSADNLVLVLLTFVLCFLGLQYLPQSYFIKVVSWLIIIISGVCVYFILKLSKLENTYNKGGVLYQWYDIKLNERGTRWLIKVFEELLQKNLINNEELVVVSPSANKGVYEKELFKSLCNKKVNTKFIVTDINLIDNHEESIRNEDSEYVFLDESNDAKEIAGILNKANQEKADVILDLEGCLWYIKEFGWYKKEKCVDQFLDVLQRYNNVLSSGGMIIVDNTKTRTIEVILRQFSHFFAHLDLSLPEHSTGWYIKKICSNNKYKNISRFIDETFSMHDIEAINEKNNTMSVLCLKKK